MVQLMGSRKKAGVKLEVDDSLQNQLPPLRKRSRPDPSSQGVGDLEAGEVIFSPSTCNPLEEPCPLGLSLKKSPSFLELIQMKLSQENAKRFAASKKKDAKGSSVLSAADKLKASNFPASLLKIGSWEYKSRYEGDLVAKCYFAKHKLVWEVLDGGLKNKIEIQWSDIVAIKANCSEDGPETLDVVLARQPLFFRETNPQPRKHTLWQATTDFTGGQASIQRRHFLQCQQGLLGRHFEKLILCDPRLNYLSKQPAIVLESPYFKSQEFDDSSDLSHGVELGRQRPSIFDFPDPSSPSAYQSSSCMLEDAGRSSSNFCSGSPSSSSRAGSHAIGDLHDSGTREGKLFSSCDQIKFPGVHPSMSMNDLVNHIGNCISGGIASLAGEKQLQGKELLEDITQYLLGDSQQAPASEEVLMSRVNSLCCLLQKDSVSTPKSLGRKEGEGEASNGDKSCARKITSSPGDKSCARKITSSPGDKSCARKITSSPGNGGNGTPVHMWKDSAATGKRMGKDSAATGYHDSAASRAGNRAMLRKDSVGDLLLNLPKIASLPRFLFDISECDKMCR